MEKGKQENNRYTSLCLQPVTREKQNKELKLAHTKMEIQIKGQEHQYKNKCSFKIYTYTFQSKYQSNISINKSD